MTTEIANLNEAVGIETWNQTQYYAWVMFGSLQTVQAFYWLQNYYVNFWMAKPTSYESEVANNRWYNGYALFALAESVSVIILMIVNSVSVLLWCLTASNFQWLIIWYLNWVELTHYIDGIRFLWLLIVRTIGMWTDHQTSYYGYDGLSHNYKVSKEHFIDFWDFMMQFGALTVSFGFYPDLKSIKYIKPKKS